MPIVYSNLVITFIIHCNPFIIRPHQRPGRARVFWRSQNMERAKGRQGVAAKAADRGQDAP